MHTSIHTSINYGGIELKNPIIFAPTTMGLPQEKYKEKIQTIAAGGCAMVIIGDVPVKKKGKHSLFNKKAFALYTDLCNSIHKYNAKACAQLYVSDANIRGMLKYIPGVLFKRISKMELRDLLDKEVSPYISNMPAETIRTITHSFGNAAKRAVDAGFDMVQVHGDRMCGSFSSLLYNSRTDSYGGSVENRTRFAVEAISAIRQASPDIPIEFKLAVRQEKPHYGNAGVLLEDLPVVIPLLENAGVTSFHVSLANHGKLTDTIPPRDHEFFKGEGCFLPYADAVRAYTRLPICAVGGFTSPDFVEKQLGTGRIQAIAMSRQLLADAEWVNKVHAGAENTIRTCIRCNRKCLGGVQKHEGVGCIYDAK